MRMFWTGNLVGVVTFFGVLVAVIAGLSYIGRMPAPAMTVVQHLDEKLRYLRDHPDLTPELVAVGSSIAWRQFDGKPFAERLGEGHVLNGASAFLKVHQTRFLTNFYIDHFPRLQTVMVMVGPTDFRDCSSVPAELFDPTDASGYAFERHPSLIYYLKYFAPLTYLRRVNSFQKSRVPLKGEMWMDEYGSGPMQWTESMMQGLRYGAITLDKRCVDALQQLVSDLTTRGIRPVVIFPPIHPDYRQLFPQTIVDLKAIAEELRTSTDGRIQIIDVIEDPFGPEDFFDAVHLQWTAAQSLSRKLTASVLPTFPADPTNTSLLR
jgi:hypothetical protein